MERPPSSHDTQLKNARRIAGWLDDAYIDPLLGFLLPGVGDALGAGFGVYLMVLARQRGASNTVLLRMALNILVDVVGGSVPIAGDLFDAVHKSHKKNVALIEKGTLKRREKVASWLGFAAIVLALLAVVSLAAAGAIWLAVYAWRLVTG